MAGAGKQIETNGSAAAKAAGRVAEDMADFADKAKRALGSAGEFAGDMAGGAVRGGKAAGRFVVKEVKEHPIRSLAIGAAVGILVAAWLMRKRDGDDE
jgi:ElaB/YqjD/DUF883 family membrane-anchored ribosome-binding protein